MSAVPKRGSSDVTANSTFTYPQIRESQAPESGAAASDVLNKLSFSHIAELLQCGTAHENIGQLNTYVSWYRKNMMTEGDNPPVGILLCTQKEHALVEYALAGIDNGLFVSKYSLELPKKEDMQRFIEEQLAAGFSEGA